MAHKVIISGGGTGGHVYPAIAIADALRAKDTAIDILFVGAEGKMEMERVPRAGYAIIGLPVAGFHRRLTLKNLSFPFKLLRSMRKAKSIIRDFAPAVAVGVGGYASGPVLRAASASGCNTIIQEQNSYPGLTNKILSRRASKICVAYEGMERFFPADKIVITGNPVRADIRDLTNKRAGGQAHFGLNPAKKTILVLGGSLGARTLNNAMRAAKELIAAQPDIQWLWQCGKLYFEEFKNSDVARLPNVHILQFIDQMDAAYAVADLIVSRAGAISISEICVAGRPAILVPSPNVAEDHQTKNALALVNKDAAQLVTDAGATEVLIAEALNLIQQPERLNILAQNAAALGKPHAADAIAGVIMAHLKQAAA